MRHNQDKIEQLFHKALRQYRLIDNGDRVLVGLSGGKDSLCLTEFLGRRSRIHFPKFEVEALHVQTKPTTYQTDITWLQAFCGDCGVKLNVVSVPIEKDRNQRRSPCFLCSWDRRKALFEYAQKNSFNTIALGHHQDDMIQTLLMNLTYEGSCGTMPALLVFKKMPLKLIRPLCLVPENLIRQYADERQYQQQLKFCPYDNVGKRKEVSILLDKMESLNPNVRQSLWHMLETEGKIVEDSDNSE